MIGRICFAAIFFVSVMSSAGDAFGQAQQIRRARAGIADRPCSVAGSYRVDVGESDRLYSVVRGATGKVPFAEQQRFFMDLSLRLTPPDILAIECVGRRVSIGSSRSPKVTFTADGATRVERSRGGSMVRSRVMLTHDTLTFTSSGKAEDSVNVAFRALDGGQRLEVTRRINAEQLTEPVVIRTIYNRVTQGAVWNSAGEIARLPDETAAPRTERRGTDASSEADMLRNALDDWISATNSRDIERQMSFYGPQLDAFYLTRNTPKAAVRNEKRARLFLPQARSTSAPRNPRSYFRIAAEQQLCDFEKSIEWRTAGGREMAKSSRNYVGGKPMVVGVSLASGMSA